MLTTEENFHRHLWGVATNQSGTVTVGNVIYYVLLFLLLFYWLYLCYRWRARRAILFHLNESCRESGHVLTEVFAPETLLPMAGEHGGVNYLVYNTWGARRMKCWFCAACQGRRHPLETCRRCQTCGINLCVVCSSTRHVVGFGGPTVPVLVVATPGQLPPASASAVYVQHQAPPPSLALALRLPSHTILPPSLPLKLILQQLPMAWRPSLQPNLFTHHHTQILPSIPPATIPLVLIPTITQVL